MDELVADVECRAKSEQLSTQHEHALEVQEDACDAATEKLLQRCRKEVPPNLLLQLQRQRALQVALDPGFSAKMHFEVEKSATSELVELGGKSVQLLKKPHADEYKAVRRRIYMIDYDMRAAHKPPGGLRCPRCGSTALKVRFALMPFSLVP
jgi:hypothetical protein